MAYLRNNSCEWLRVKCNISIESTTNQKPYPYDRKLDIAVPWQAYKLVLKIEILAPSSLFKQ